MRSQATHGRFNEWSPAYRSSASHVAAPAGITTPCLLLDPIDRLAASSSISYLNGYFISSTPPPCQVPATPSMTRTTLAGSDWSAAQHLLLDWKGTRPSSLRLLRTPRRGDLNDEDGRYRRVRSVAGYALFKMTCTE